MKLKYIWCDLNDQSLKKEFCSQIESFGGPTNIPIILINGIYIGGINDLQDLVDEGWLNPILEKCNIFSNLIVQNTKTSVYNVKLQENPLMIIFASSVGRNTCFSKIEWKEARNTLKVTTRAIKTIQSINTLIRFDPFQTAVRGHPCQ